MPFCLEISLRIYLTQKYGMEVAIKQYLRGQIIIGCSKKYGCVIGGNMFYASIKLIKEALITKVFI